MVEERLAGRGAGLERAQRERRARDRAAAIVRDVRRVLQVRAIARWMIWIFERVD